MEQLIVDAPEATFVYWYDEPEEETGTIEVSSQDALQIVKAVNGEGELPASVPTGYGASLYYIN
jgi:hypothetical protein